MTIEAARIIERVIRSLRSEGFGWGMRLVLADELQGALEIELRASLAKVSR